MREKPKKIITPEMAFKKAAEYCAIQERCQQELKIKLASWEVYGADADNIIVQLISDGFINEERFAKAFAGGKFRIKKWGKQKIRQELKARNISEYCISKGLQEIDGSEYLKTLASLMRRKETETIEKNAYRKMNKIASFLIAKGYESELVWDVLRNKYAE